MQEKRPGIPLQCWILPTGKNRNLKACFCPKMGGF